MQVFWLQWSHDLSVVEWRGGAHAPAGRGRASMEPRPLGRGMFSPASPRSWLPRSLQWSHDLSVVEWSPRPTGCLRGPRLQWSHDLSVVECSRPTACSATADALQWSHDLSVVECRGVVRRAVRGAVASMEPRPLGRGMFGRIYVYDQLPNALQWSHDLSVVEWPILISHQVR